MHCVYYNIMHPLQNPTEWRGSDEESLHGDDRLATDFDEVDFGGETEQKKSLIAV